MVVVEFKVRKEGPVPMTSSSMPRIKRESWCAKACPASRRLDEFYTDQGREISVSLQKNPPPGKKGMEGVLEVDE